VADDREGQLAVLAMKVLGVGAGLGGLGEGCAAYRLVDAARNLGRCRMNEAQPERKADPERQRAA
jgi:hypothetical protein